MENLLDCNTRRLRKSSSTTIPEEQVLLIINNPLEGIKYILANKGSIEHSTIKVISGLRISSVPSSIVELGYTSMPIINTEICEVHQCSI